jgi:peptidyl-prolyl cis-trans isomerase C
MTTPIHADHPEPKRRALRRAGTLAVIAGTMLLAVSAVSLRAEDANPVIARVDGVAIHKSDLALAEEDLGQQVQQLPEAQKQEYLINYVANLILAAKAAEARKLGDSAEFKQRLAFNRNRLLMEMLLLDAGKAAMTDEAMKKVYDEAVKGVKPEEEVHARHILFAVKDPKDEKASKEAEAKAKAALARIQKGEDFAKVASELTQDPSGKANGGDLGYFTKEQMVPQFAEVAFKLDKGKVSDPVKSQFGWHIIKIEDKRTKPVPTFDAVKGNLAQFVVRKAQSDLVTALRKDAKIERLDKPAEAPKAKDASKDDGKAAAPSAPAKK